MGGLRLASGRFHQMKAEYLKRRLLSKPAVKGAKLWRSGHRAARCFRGAQLPPVRADAGAKMTATHQQMGFVAKAQLSVRIRTVSKLSQ
jgi:hypothetical protein